MLISLQAASHCFSEAIGNLPFELFRAAMVPQVKQDPDASSPYIKPDPDSKEAIAAALDEDDLYEDAGDLDFANSAQNVWLSRIPRSLWDNWSKLDDDEEIQIGTIRIEGEPSDIKRVCLSFFIIYSWGWWGE